jgi:hypothetical protein
MLRRVIGRAPGLRVVGDVPDPAEVASLLDESEAQWVITSIWPEGVLPREIRSLLITDASLCVLGIAADGSQARIVCGDLDQETLSELSFDDLIAILHERR